MRCLLVTDAAQHWSQRSQMTFWIVFFSVTKHYLFDDGHQCNPRHLDGAVGCCCLSSEITFTSNELELSDWLFARALACARMWTYIFRKIHYLSIVCLTQITKLNCCMTGLLFGCLRDFLLLYRVNHHWNVFIRWPFLGFKKLLHTVCLKNFICNTQRIYIHVFVKLHRIKSNPSRSKVFLSHAHHSTFTLLGDISQESLSFVEIKTVKREENKTVKWHPGVTRL